MNHLKKRIYKTFSKLDLQRLAIRKPILAQLELTRNCNQTCIFCFRACNKKNKFPNLSLLKWIKILDKLWEMGIQILNISGGEILLFPELKDFLREAKRRNFRVVLNTNGSLSLLKYLQYLDQIIFSIHGLGEIHDKITGQKGAFVKAEKHLAEVLDGNTDVGINTVLTKNNFDKIEKTYRYFEQKYPDLQHHSFTLSIVCNTGYKFRKDMLQLDEETFKYYLKSINKIPRKKREYKHGLRALIDKKSWIKNAFISLPHCAAGKYKIVVTYNGDIYPCNFFLGKEYYCGNILKDDIEKIWKEGKGFKPFRKMFLNERLPKLCKTCKKKGTCFGGCRAYTESYLSKGQFSNEKDVRCVLGDAYLRDRSNN